MAPPWPPALVAFSAVLAFFHASEYALAYYCNPSTCSLHSLLFSWQYALAMATAVAEYSARQWWQPWIRYCARARLERWPCAPLWLCHDSGARGASRALLWLGLAVCAAGELLRKSAILTLRAGFTHRIQRKRRSAHTLCTRGVYGVCRHPAYLGWAVWAVGTQVLLGNAASAVLFALAAWRFFAERVPYEDRCLYAMFGAEYRQYWRRTPSGLPFIR